MKKTSHRLLPVDIRACTPEITARPSISKQAACMSV